MCTSAQLMPRYAHQRKNDPGLEKRSHNRPRQDRKCHGMHPRALSSRLFAKLQEHEENFPGLLRRMAANRNGDDRKLFLAWCSHHKAAKGQLQWQRVEQRQGHLQGRKMPEAGIRWHFGQRQAAEQYSRATEPRAENHDVKRKRNR